MTDTPEQTAETIAARGREALISRLRPAFEEAAAAHSDVLKLGPDQIEAMVQRAADRADGLQWRRALAGIATEELGISLGEALSHPAVIRAHELVGAPSYEDSLAELGPIGARAGTPLSRPAMAAAVPAPSVEEAAAPADVAEEAAAPEEPALEESAPEEPAPEEPEDVEPAAVDEPEAAEPEAAEPEAEEAEEPEAEEPEAEEPEEPEAEEPEEAEAEEPEEPEAEAEEPEEPEAEQAEEPEADELDAAEGPEVADAAYDESAGAPAEGGAATEFRSWPEEEAAEEGAPALADAGLGAGFGGFEASAEHPSEQPDQATAQYSFEEFEDEFYDEGLRISVIHLGGIANLEPAESDIELLMSGDGLDIIRGGNDVLGRLEWDQVKALEVPLPRRGRRMRRPAPTHLVIRTARGDASFEVPDVTPAELRQHLAPVIDDHIRR